MHSDPVNQGTFYCYLIVADMIHSYNNVGVA